jgi:surfeit locus 1 family protein
MNHGKIKRLTRMKKLLTRRWIITHALFIIVFITLLNFGFWQLRRLEQRRDLNAAIEAGLNAPVTPLTGQAVDPETLHLHRVTVTGTFDNEENIAIYNRPFEGRAGMRLVTPLQIEGSDQSILVDRGWLPLDETDREQRRQYDESGVVTIEGIAYRSQPQSERWGVPQDPVPGPDENRRDQWFRVDINRIEQQLPYPLMPIYVAQSADENANPITPPLREGPIELDEGSHLSYALQWFSFAAIAVIVYGILLWQELRKAN